VTAAIACKNDTLFLVMGLNFANTLDGSVLLLTVFCSHQFFGYCRLSTSLAVMLVQ